MEKFSTQAVQNAIRVALQHAGATDADVARAIKRQQAPRARYRVHRVYEDMSREQLGQRRLDRLVLGTADALARKTTRRGRAALKWFLGAISRIGLGRPWSDEDERAVRALKSLTPEMLRNDPEGARDLITQAFTEPRTIP